MSIEVCDGCGRVAGERETYCGACGRLLPGRSADPSSDAAPPGWLVAPTARDQAGPWFEPMPSVPMPVGEERSAARGVPAYRVVERREPEATAGTAPPPPPLPRAGTAPTPAGAAVAVPRPPALRALLLPLLVVALGSSAAAVLLLVLHVLRDR
ncbi:MAG TPA: hypothetical protein VN193_15155 [Candidatus Angelobacter sp.]|jgi:hypothetical protein|nr:hypothetical protein [Candidatus Angelobacter sp.]